MRFSLKIQQYPNNEIRATLYRACSPRSPVEGCLRADPQSNTQLDISSKLSRSDLGQNPGFGGVPKPTRFGLNAKRTIQRASGVFDHDKIPRGELLFLTGTIPGSRRSVYDALAKWSSWSVKSIKTWLSNLGVVDNYSMYCWEFQKRGALHIHYLVWVPDDKKRNLVMVAWQEKWAQILDSVGEREGIDMWQQSNGRSWKDHRAILQALAQTVIKSVGSYLSKYLSKNSPAPQQGIGGGNPPLCPVRWWGVSRPLLKRLAELSSEFVVEEVTYAQYRQIWEKVRDGFRNLATRTYEYCDKLGWARVLVGFDEDSGDLYNCLWRDKHHGSTSSWSGF